MVVQMLVVPHDLAGVGIERERRVVVQVLLVDTAQHELGGRRRHGRSDIDEIQNRVVAWHHPRPDVPTLLVRHITPRLVTRLARRGYRPRAPQLRTGSGVVRRDDTRLGATPRRAAATGDDFSVRNDRTRGLVRRVLGVIEHLGLPHDATRRGVQSKDEVVNAGIDDQVVIDR